MACAGPRSAIGVIYTNVTAARSTIVHAGESNERRANKTTRCIENFDTTIMPETTATRDVELTVIEKCIECGYCESVSVYRDSPRRRLIEINGKWYTEHIADDPAWLVLGYAPTPGSRWETIRYHALHGLLMGYSLRECFRYAWRHRGSFT